MMMYYQPSPYHHPQHPHHPPPPQSQSWGGNIYPPPPIPPSHEQQQQHQHQMNNNNNSNNRGPRQQHNNNINKQEQQQERNTTNNNKDTSQTKPNIVENNENNKTNDTKKPKSWADIARDPEQEQQEQPTVEQEKPPQQEHHQQNKPPKIIHQKQQINTILLPTQRLHHYLPKADAILNAQQLTMAQTIATDARQMNVDPMAYQSEMAVMHGIDPILLQNPPPPQVPRLGRDPLILGQMMWQDPGVYPHIVLVTLYPHLTEVNRTIIDPKIEGAQYFLIRCEREQQVHRSVKYFVWDINNIELALHLSEIYTKSASKPIYLIFISEDSRYISGVAELTSPTSLNNNGYHQCSVRWLYVKDVHLFSPIIQETQVLMHHAIVQNLHHGVTEVTPETGSAVIQAIIDYQSLTSVLMDFKYYDEAESRGMIKIADRNIPRIGGGSSAEESVGGGGGYNNNNDVTRYVFGLFCFY